MFYWLTIGDYMSPKWAVIEAREPSNHQAVNYPHDRQAMIKNRTVFTTCHVPKNQIFHLFLRLLRCKAVLNMDQKVQFSPNSYVSNRDTCRSFQVHLRSPRQRPDQRQSLATSKWRQRHSGAQRLGQAAHVAWRWVVLRFWRWVGKFFRLKVFDRPQHFVCCDQYYFLDFQIESVFLKKPDTVRCVKSFTQGGATQTMIGSSLILYNRIIADRSCWSPGRSMNQ